MQTCGLVDTGEMYGRSDITFLLTEEFFLCLTVFFLSAVVQNGMSKTVILYQCNIKHFSPCLGVQ